ncbi:MAG TPA: zinc-binding dehydrogenase [Solirubrobacteraceae bacterium]|jgi:NADPH2:quinone reductase
MRAAILRWYGAPPEPGEFDEPRPADGHEVVDVVAGGLNPVDIRMASGTFYGGAPPLPSVAGREGIGRRPDGELVYFDAPITPYGSFAERAPIAPESAIPLPAEIDPGLALAFGIAGLAAWLALEWRGQLREGESVLVLGASGVVGQIAVQAARLLGAQRVVAAARSPEGLDRARGLGADAVVNLAAAEDDLVEALLEAAGAEGFDLIVDPVWGEPAAAALEACRPGGRLVQLGESAGPYSALASATIRGKLLAILGHTNFRAPADVKRAAFQRMVEHAAAGELTAEVERVPLERVADAWVRQQHSPHRKIVVVP